MVDGEFDGLFRFPLWVCFMKLQRQSKEIGQMCESICLPESTTASYRKRAAGKPLSEGRPSRNGVYSVHATRDHRPAKPPKGCPAEFQVGFPFVLQEPLGCHGRIYDHPISHCSQLLQRLHHVEINPTNRLPPVQDPVVECTTIRRHPATRSSQRRSSRSLRIALTVVAVGPVARGPFQGPRPGASPFPRRVNSVLAEPWKTAAW